eukprot:4708364-Pleurochrysis_carterae.AAC.1
MEASLGAHGGFARRQARSLLIDSFREKHRTKAEGTRSQLGSSRGGELACRVRSQLGSSRGGELACRGQTPVGRDEDERRSERARKPVSDWRNREKRVEKEGEGE